MVFDVIIGRSKKDVAKYGKEGTILIGKQYIQMGQTTSLSNPVYMDVASAHVCLSSGREARENLTRSERSLKVLPISHKILSKTSP